MLLFVFAVTFAHACQAIGGLFDERPAAISVEAVAGLEDVEILLSLMDFERLPKTFLHPDQGIFASIHVENANGDVVRDFPLYSKKDSDASVPTKSDWMTPQGDLRGFARRIRVPWKMQTSVSPNLNLPAGRYRFKIGVCHRFVIEPLFGIVERDRQIELGWKDPRSLTIAQWSNVVELDLPSSHVFHSPCEGRHQRYLIPDDRSLRVDMRCRTKVPGQLQVGEGIDVELRIEGPPESRIMINQFSLSNRFGARVAALLVQSDRGPVNDLFAETFLSHGGGRFEPTPLYPGIVAIFRRSVVQFPTDLYSGDRVPKTCVLQAEVWAALFGTHQFIENLNRVAVSRSQELEFQVTSACQPANE